MAFSSSQGMHTTHFAMFMRFLEIFFLLLQAAAVLQRLPRKIGSRGRTHCVLLLPTCFNNVGQSDLKIIPLQASCEMAFRIQIAAPLSSHWPSPSRNLLAMAIALVPFWHRRGAQSSNSDPRRVAHSVQDSQRWQIALPMRIGMSVKLHLRCQALHNVA